MDSQPYPIQEVKRFELYDTLKLIHYGNEVYTVNECIDLWKENIDILSNTELDKLHHLIKEATIGIDTQIPLHNGDSKLFG